MLEAMRAGSIDFGSVGDSPAILAQAGHVDMRYVGAMRGGTVEILLPEGSKIETVADLNGKRVGFYRGSNAQNLIDVVLEKAGLSYLAIEPVYLTQADAAAAFRRGVIDAWVIQDPICAMYEAMPGVRVLPIAADLSTPYTFFVARRAFVEAYPDVVTRAVAAMGEIARWTAAHRPEMAQHLAELTGVPPDAMLRSVMRDQLTILPLDETVVRAQQNQADRFLAMGLIRERIDVRAAVWVAPTASLLRTVNGDR
jgi:sulfonate transport system substrate-binding protein